MKIIILLFFIVYINGLSEEFENLLANLNILEKYMREYIKDKKPDSTPTHLIACYIREGAYSGMEWTIAGGALPSDLVQYIADKDSSEGTNAQSCRKYREINLPNNEMIDFVHLFAVINGIEFGNSYSGVVAHLVGWGGDTTQLIQDIQNEEGDLEELMNKAKEFFMIKGGFGPADFVSDLDAPILLKKKNDNNNFADIIRNYYNSKEYLNRINNFVELTFPSIKKKEEVRNKIFEIYSKDEYIKRLESKYEIREGSYIFPGEVKPQYVNHQKAAVYVFADYLAERYDPPKNKNSGFSLSLFKSYLISLLALLLFIL